MLEKINSHRRGNGEQEWKPSSRHTNTTHHKKKKKKKMGGGYKTYNYIGRARIKSPNDVDRSLGEENWGKRNLRQQTKGGGSKPGSGESGKIGSCRAKKTEENNVHCAEELV